MDIFTRFKTAIKIREVLIDNNVFQLHYRVTALLLLGCAALVASKQHFGDPIDCITRDDVPNKIMDTYCWIHATFTLPEACNKTVGTEVAHPCVDKSNTNHEDRVYHKYYQWVYFVLFFQAACFYAPHFFWKSCEGKLMLKICSSMRSPLNSFNCKDLEEEELQEEEELKEKKKEVDKETKEMRQMLRNIVMYLMKHRDRHQNYFYYFTMFEVINLINVIGQMFVVNSFLGGTFTSYGLDVLSYSQMDQDERVDPMVRIFPRMTKCTFHRFGSSGDVQRHDALCILPLNIINEKIYIIMWFWFVFLAAVTSLWLVYRLATFMKSEIRYQALNKRARFTDASRIKHVLNETSSGDWFLLYMMCKNIDPQWFRLIINRFSSRLDRLDIDKSRKNGNRASVGDRRALV